MADAVAPSHFFAVNLTQHGEVEDHYFSMLRPTIYRHAKSGELGYGLRFWPGSLETLSENMTHLPVFCRQNDGCEMTRVLGKRAKKCRPQARVSRPFGLPVLALASTNLTLAYACALAE